MKITKIQLKNYRAFYATHTIDTNNKNLLIYGENGSGKTSLYQSIVDFFVVTEKGLTDLPFNKNHWNKLSTSPEKEIIKIDFDDNSTVEFTPNVATPKSNADFERIAKQSPFYTYKRILKTYISDESVERQLLLLLVKEIVATYVDSEGKSILDYWQTLKTLSEIEGRITPTITAQQAEMTDFTKSLADIVGDLVNQLNDFLVKYFHTSIHLTITTPIFTNTHTKIKDIRNYAKQSLENAPVQIKVKFFDKEIDNHAEFLNEARLSALAICMYLASLKVIPAPKNLKILFLDDIFIGLDMSNRLPLLAILKNELPDYQIFMTTYDRAWFEVAKDNLNNSWKAIEMYVGEKDGFDVPVIIDENLEPFEKAEMYFKAHDYFAAGNYLRRTIEKLFEKLIPITYRLEAENLSSTINKISQYYDDCACTDLLPETTRQSIKQYKDIVFNPASHYDLRSPLYKAEIQNAIELVKLLRSLPKIERKLLVGMKSNLYYENSEKQYKATFITSENIYGIFVENQEPRITDSKHKLIDYTYPNDTNKTINSTEFKLSERIARIKHKLQLDDLPTWKEVFYNSEGKTLQQLIDDL